MAAPRLAFLASHNGSSARAIVQACAQGVLAAQPALMLSNTAVAGALTWAQEAGIPAFTVSSDADILALLRAHGADWVILSGYMKLIGADVVRTYPRRILNVHPALLPAYGGKGMYGRRVHDAVKASGDTATGITIHYVDEIYDHGEIIAQKTIPVLPSDTAEDIESRVKAAEPGFFVETLKALI